jgi:hypothetical protein
VAAFGVVCSKQNAEAFSADLLDYFYKISLKKKILNDWDRTGELS